MICNMHCELKFLEVSFVMLTLWAKDNKGVGHMSHVFISAIEWQTTGIIWFSVFRLLLHCRNFYSLSCTSVFHFVSVHLSSAKPITWGGHHVFRVWEDDIISVNLILSLSLAVSECCVPSAALKEALQPLLPSPSVFFLWFFSGIFMPQEMSKILSFLVCPPLLAFAVLPKLQNLDLHLVLRIEVSTSLRLTLH